MRTFRKIYYPPFVLLVKVLVVIVFSAVLVTLYSREPSTFPVLLVVFVAPGLIANLYSLLRARVLVVNDSGLSSFGVMGVSRMGWQEMETLTTEPETLWGVGAGSYAIRSAQAELVIPTDQAKIDDLVRDIVYQTDGRLRFVTVIPTEGVVVEARKAVFVLMALLIVGILIAAVVYEFPLAVAGAISLFILSPLIYLPYRVVFGRDTMTANLVWGERRFQVSDIRKIDRAFDTDFGQMFVRFQKGTQYIVLSGSIHRVSLPHLCRQLKRLYPYLG